MSNIIRAVVPDDGVTKDLTATVNGTAVALDVNIASGTLEIEAPVGGATEAKQDDEIAALESIDSKITAVDTGAVTVAASALPTGAATGAKQDTGNTSLSSIDTKTPALASGRVPVDGSGVTQPVSAAALPLPAGAATEATLSTLNGKVTAVNTGAVVLTTGSASIGTVQPGNTANTTPWLVNEAGAGSSAVTSVTAAASSTSILASTAGRKGAAFYNDSTAILYLKLGATASTTSYTVQIPASAYYELPGPKIYTGAIDGIWAAANGAVRVTELS